MTAEAGPADATHLILRHEAGPTSTVTVTLSAAEPAALEELYLWGEAGRSLAPPETGQPVIPLRTALTELAANARSGHLGHPCDVRFGCDVVRVLAKAQRQLDAVQP